MIDLSIVSHEYVSRCKDMKYFNCLFQISFSLLGSELLLVSRNEGDMNVAIFIILKS